MHQNEFIFIWLYIAFAAFFWYQEALIIMEDEQYGFKNEDTYRYMSIATLALAATTTFSLIYFIFYSISKRVASILKLIELNFQYLAAYILAVIWLIAGMAYRPEKINEDLTTMSLIIYIVLSFYIVTVVLI